MPPVIAALVESGAAMAVTRRIVGARRLSGDALAGRVADAYRAVAAATAAAGRPHLVRIWNGVPGIHDRLGDCRDRYMAFNAGRHAAMRAWYGDGLVDRAPAASGVGIEGDDLIVHALATAAPGRAVQNPRQTPAARYSARFGPLPPCFARATLVDGDGGPTLFVSGTAAILGEASMHPADFDAQLALTLDNLRAVVAASGIKTGGDPLATFTSVRAYVPPAEAFRFEAGDAGVAPTAFPNAGPIEVVRAQLCRRELLVEIEGVAAAGT